MNHYDTCASCQNEIRNTRMEYCDNCVSKIYMQFKEDEQPDGVILGGTCDVFGDDSE